MLYCYLAVQRVAGIGTIWDLISYGKLDATINLIPFSSEGFATYILNVIMLKEKFSSFSEKDIALLKMDKNINIDFIKIKNPDNPAILLDAVYIYVKRK